MATWFHTTILATGFAATLAVGLASASMLIQSNAVAQKADRLPVVADASGYVTVETRENGVSVLNRIPLD